MCEFKIQELALLNYRRFENEKFTLNPRMNVFAGKNGSGKTTVLEAANVMLGAYLAAYKTYVPSRFVYNMCGRKHRFLKTVRFLPRGRSLNILVKSAV